MSNPYSVLKQIQGGILSQADIDAFNADNGQVGDTYPAIDPSPSEEEAVEPDPARGGSRFNGHWIKTQGGWKFIKDKVWYE
jgi:hypothetical protein